MSKHEVIREGVKSKQPSGRVREAKTREGEERKASRWPLTPAAIMSPVIMERLIGRRGVRRVAVGLRVRAPAGRLVAVVVGRVLQRQRNPLTFVT